MKSAFLLLALCSSLLLSCKKNNEPAGSGKQAFTLVERIPSEVRLYEQADLVIYNNRPFISASSNEFGNAYSTFLFPLSDGWRSFSQPNQQFVLLTTFNNTLYGLLEFRQPFQNGQVASFRYSYFLYKWNNNSFENIARLDFTDINGEIFSPLSSWRWWISQGKLQLVGQESNGTSWLWNLTNDRFGTRTEIGRTNLNKVVLSAPTGISFTNYRQLNNNIEQVDVVQGLFYNGTTLQAGREFSFRESRDGIFSNIYSFYVAIDSTLFGTRGRQLRNINTDQTVVELPAPLKFQSDKILVANGKLYAIIGKDAINCKTLSVFDGFRFKEYSYTLPPGIDPCARLLDAEEVNGQLYCLLLGNRQLYVVQQPL